MPERRPQGDAEEGKREEQVGGEAEVADGGAVNQSAGDHVPAHESLPDKEQSHHNINAEFLEWDDFLEKEIEHRNRIEQTCQARDQAVDPLHVENELIFRERHAGVDLDVLRRELIFGEFLPPGLHTDGGHHAADGIPFDNGKPRAGQADKSSEDNEKGYHEAKNKQPFHDGVVFGFWHDISPVLMRSHPARPANHKDYSTQAF